MQDNIPSLGFLLDAFVQRVPGVRNLIAVSGDGLLSAMDSSLDRDVAERLAAASSGLVSLLRAMAEDLSVGRLSHNMTEFEGARMLVMSAGPSGGCLVLVAADPCDLGLVSFELTTLVKSVGDRVVPNGRARIEALHDVLV
jgi:predicted regulator of Ras-like GTPase activity (Roadblock/LC7/MglB family)